MEVSFPDTEKGGEGVEGRGTPVDKVYNCPTLKQQKQGGEVDCVQVELILIKKKEAWRTKSSAVVNSWMC